MARVTFEADEHSPSSRSTMAMCCAGNSLALRGVDGNGSVYAARRADQSQSIDDAIVQ